MKKLKLQNFKTSELLTREQLKKIEGGSGNGCPTGEFPCKCNGVDYGCVSSVNDCWNKC